MAEHTGISWTHHTFNPWWGCVKVSPACDGCYAEADSKRYGFQLWGKDSERRFFSDKHWAEPLKWNAAAEKAGARRRVFCASMADVMEDRPGLEIHRFRLFLTIKATPHLDWLLLTKRPQNFRRLLPPEWLDGSQKNIWLGTTVESPEYLWRVTALKQVPATIHFLSMEPMVAPVPTLGEYLDDIEWVITGGESGHKARPQSPDTFRQIRDAAVSRGIAFHFKQWGEHGGDLVKIGKKKAGRELDGREWLEFPASGGAK